MVELGFLQLLIVFNITESFDFYVFHPCLLFFTAPYKDLIWFMKENKGYSKLFLIFIFRALPLRFLPFCSWLPSLFIFILFSSCWFQRMPVAILQQNSGYGCTHNKLAYALSMSLPLLLSTPAAFPPCTSGNWLKLKSSPTTTENF